MHPNLVDNPSPYLNGLNPIGQEKHLDLGKNSPPGKFCLSSVTSLPSLRALRGSLGWPFGAVSCEKDNCEHNFGKAIILSQQLPLPFASNVKRGDGTLWSTWGVTCNAATWAETTETMPLKQCHFEVAWGACSVNSSASFQRSTAIIYEVTSYVRNGPVMMQLLTNNRWPGDSQRESGQFVRIASNLRLAFLVPRNAIRKKGFFSLGTLS